MSDLNPRAKALIDAIRYAEDPSDEEIEHVHYKVLSQVAVGAAAGIAATAAAKTAMAASAQAAAAQVGAGAAAAAAHTGVAAGTGAAAGVGAVAATSGAVAVVKFGALGALVGALTLGTTTIVSHRQEAASASAPVANPVAAQVMHSSAGQRWASPVIPEVQTAPPVEVASASAPEPRPAPVLAASAQPISPLEGQLPAMVEPVGTTLEAELSLMRQARSALNQGQVGFAVSILDEHAKRFPAGVLAEDRVAIRIVALCSSGRGAQVRGDAERFLTSHPRSSHAASVRSACGLESPSAVQTPTSSMGPGEQRKSL